MEYVIDCRNINSFTDFIHEVNKGLIIPIGGLWDGNLDAFHDYLSQPPKYTLVLKGRKRCEEVLGHAAAAARLKRVLKKCHPNNVEMVRRDLHNAQQGKGPTLWDIILEILHNNKDWVNLVMEE